MHKNLNDFIIEIFQDFSEIESIIRILKDSVCNENIESSMQYIGNTLEIIITKISNTKILLDKLYRNYI